MDALIADGKRSNEEATKATIYAMKNRPDRSAVLQNFRKPILLIIGENDVAVPIEDSLKQSEIGEQTEALVLKNCGHMGMIEKPTTTLLRIKEFLFAYVLAMSTTLYIGKGFRNQTLGSLPQFFKKIDAIKTEGEKRCYL